MITDDTLREGMQAPGISFSIEEKRRLSRRIAECGIDRILLSYPPAHSSECEIASLVSSEKSFSYVYGLGRAIRKDIDTIHSTGSHISLHFPFKYDSIDEIYEAVRYAVSLDPLTEVSVVDITQYRIDQLVKIVKKLSDLKVETIQLPDTMGRARPTLIREVVAESRKSCGSSKIEIHCHNDHGFSTANAIAGLEAGADLIDTTFLGIGERNGITDTLTLATYLSEMGISSKFSLDRMRSLSLEILDLVIKKAGEKFFSENIPNIGKNIITHTAGTHAAFSGVFAGENFSVNVYTGRSMINRILMAGGKRISDENLSRLIEILKDRSAAEGRVLPTGEVLKEAESFVQSD